MTSVKPIFQSETKSSSDFGHSNAGRDGKRENPIDASTLTNTFRYSIPYTQDRSKVHARGVDQQWKRTIILTVRESFPGIYSRQPVVASKCSELSPIEVRTSPSPLYSCHPFLPTPNGLMYIYLNLCWNRSPKIHYSPCTGLVIITSMISCALGVSGGHPGESGYNAEGAWLGDQRHCRCWY